MTFCRAAALAALVIAMPAWAVNKCTGPDGSATFQDAPCEAKSPPGRDDLAELRKGSKPVQSTANAELVRRMNADAAEAGRQAAAERERAKTELDRVCKGKSHAQPAVGMSEATAMNCLDTGQPVLVSEMQTATGVARQYAYERTVMGTRYLFIRNGQVVVVQR